MRLRFNLRETTLSNNCSILKTVGFLFLDTVKKTNFFQHTNRSTIIVQQCTSKRSVLLYPESLHLRANIFYKYFRTKADNSQDIVASIATSGSHVTQLGWK